MTKLYCSVVYAKRIHVSIELWHCNLSKDLIMEVMSLASATSQFITVFHRLFFRTLKQCLYSKKWLLLIFMLGLVYCTCILLCKQEHQLSMDNEKYIGTQKCPACYGTSLCEEIKNGSLFVRGIPIFSVLGLWGKNVHRGRLSNDKHIILKSLGHRHEIEELDTDICRKSEYTLGCDIKAAIQKHPLVTAAEINPSIVRGMDDLVACPSQRLVDLIQDRFTEGRGKQSDLVRMPAGDIGRMYLATILMINPEPLIMQVDYAYQVMQIAELFTENDLGFALYLTDLTFDNLAVNSDGKVIVVDLENIIVVDKSKLRREKKPGWDVPYSSEYDACPNQDGSCISFSVDKLCSQYTADFNYYTACRNLLSEDATSVSWKGGLLHDLPHEVDFQLRPLLKECSRLTLKESRFEIKDQLMKKLSTIRNDVL